MTIDKLAVMNITEILDLPSSEKLLLIEELWDSLDTNELEITTSQKQELDRRIALDKNGEMPWYTWNEVKSYLQSKR